VPEVRHYFRLQANPVAPGPGQSLTAPADRPSEVARPGPVLDSAKPKSVREDPAVESAEQESLLPSSPAKAGAGRRGSARRQQRGAPRQTSFGVRQEKGMASVYSHWAALPTLEEVDAGKSSAAKSRVAFWVMPEDASIYIDYEFVGTPSSLSVGLMVETGKHRLEVVRPGYIKRTVALDLSSEPKLVRLSLMKCSRWGRC